MRYDIRKLSDILELEKHGLAGQDRIVIHFDNYPPIRIRVWEDNLVREQCDSNGDAI